MYTEHIPVAERRYIYLYEDNAGGLYLVPEGEGIVIEMLQDGDFATDARLYRDSWCPSDCRESVYPIEGAERPVGGARWDRATVDVTEGPGMRLIATYDRQTDTVRIERDAYNRTVRAGSAGQEYLRYTLYPEETTFEGTFTWSKVGV